MRARRRFTARFGAGWLDFGLTSYVELYRYLLRCTYSSRLVPSAGTGRYGCTTGTGPVGGSGSGSGSVEIELYSTCGVPVAVAVMPGRRPRGGRAGGERALRAESARAGTHTPDTAPARRRYIVSRSCTCSLVFVVSRNQVIQQNSLRFVCGQSRDPPWLPQPATHVCRRGVALCLSCTPRPPPHPHPHLSPTSRPSTPATPAGSREALEEPSRSCKGSASQ